MKKIDRKTAIALSLLFALITAFVWNRSVNQRVANAREATQVQMVQVATAAVDINPRQMIQPDMVRVIEQPMDEAPEGAFGQAADVQGTVAMRMIPAGTPITRTIVQQNGPNLGLAYSLPDGRRAMAVALDPVSGVAGFLKPGDHVDVLATYSASEMDVTRTVLQDVTLMAIGSSPINVAQYRQEDEPALKGGQDPNKATVDAPTATLAVWPDQAQTLALASAKARIHLVLRPVDDVAPTPLPPTNTTKVFGFAPQQSERLATPPPAIAVREMAPPPPPPAPVRAAVQPEPKPAPPAPAPAPKEPVIVIRGTQQSEVVVPE